MKSEINDMQIALASDENYLPFAYVTIYSVLQQRKEQYFINFTIMVPEKTKPISINRFWQFYNYKITYKEVPDEYFGNLKMNIPHITKPTYYRLIISKLLSDTVTKCLYLDTDIIVLDDLRALYEMDFEDSYVIGGKCSELIANVAGQKKYADYLQIPDMNSYVNAGVLLFNLEELRNNKMCDVFLKSSTQNWDCQDQDVINNCCYGKIKIFDYRYNIYSFAFGVNSNWLESTLKKEEVDTAMDKPAIIHYATKVAKPWFNLMGSKVDLWWLFAKQALPSDMFNDFYQRALFETHHVKIPSYIGGIEKMDKLIVFGYGVAGKEFLLYMKQMNPDCNIVIFDNNCNGTYYEGIEVSKPYYDCNTDVKILITVQKNQDSIKNELVELGYSEEQIMNYVRGDIETWFSIAPEYRRLFYEG